MNSYFIILGGSLDQLYLIKNIHELKYKCIVFDKNRNCPAKKVADIFFPIDFSQYQKVIKKLIECKKKKNINLKGIITMGCDVPLLIVKIAKKFKLQHNSIKSAKVSQNKYLMKKMLKKSKIETPNFKLIKNYTQILDFWKKKKSKYLIVKPIDSSGSKGVLIIQSKNKIKEMFEKNKNNMNKNYFIVEEFYEGLQLSSESLIYKNKIFTPGLSHRNYSENKYFLPNIIENGGTAYAGLEKYKLKIEKIKKNICKMINFREGIIKGDFIISKNRVILIEFATRLSGGDFSESVAPNSNGINYVKEAINISGNMPININNLKKKFNKVSANRYFFLPPGLLKSIKGLKKIKKIKELNKIKIFYKVNEKVPIIDNHGKRVGVFVVTGKNIKLVNSIIKKIYKIVKFNINNQWVIGNPNSLYNQKKLYHNLKPINMSR